MELVVTYLFWTTFSTPIPFSPSTDLNCEAELFPSLCTDLVVSFRILVNTLRTFKCLLWSTFLLPRFLKLYCVLFVFRTNKNFEYLEGPRKSRNIEIFSFASWGFVLLVCEVRKETRWWCVRKPRKLGTFSVRDYTEFCFPIFRVFVPKNLEYSSNLYNLNRKTGTIQILAT